MPNRTEGDAERSELVTPRAAMARLKVSRQTLTRYADAGHLTAVVLPSGHRRYRLDDVERLATAAAT